MSHLRKINVVSEHFLLKQESRSQLGFLVNLNFLTSDLRQDSWSQTLTLRSLHFFQHVCHSEKQSGNLKVLQNFRFLSQIINWVLRNKLISDLLQTQRPLPSSLHIHSKDKSFLFLQLHPSLTDTDILILVLSDNVNRSRNGSGDNREEEGELESKIKAEAIV